MAAQWVPTTRPPGPPLRLSVPVLVLGIAAIVIAFVGLGRALVRTVSDAPVLTSPGSVTVQCRSGSYVLYVESGSPPLPSAPGAVVVRGPAGAAIPLQLQSRGESVTRGGERFSGQVSFNVSSGGSYTVSVRGAGVTVLVAPSFTTIARENLGWVILLLIGVLAALAGVVLLIVGAIRRSRAKRLVATSSSGPWSGLPGSWQPPGPWPGSPQPPRPSGGWPAWPPPPPPGESGRTAPPGWSPPPAEEPRPDPGGWPRPSPPGPS